jgi:putative glutamine amidotransferase
MTPLAGRSPPRIGVSACIMHADPARPVFKGKTLLYAEESLLKWIMSAGAIPWLLPRATAPLGIRDLLADLDGVILQGGVDISPQRYGEEPLRTEWSGDPARDEYDMEIVRTCLELDLPLLGICRGAQVLNVALGGSLYQDIETMHDGGRVHRNWELYDRHEHELHIEPDSTLARWYQRQSLAVAAPIVRTNSVHHQGLKTIGRDLVVEARSLPDGVVEAVRFDGRVNGRAPFAYGVQWHPEFLATTPIEDQLDPGTLMRGFLGEVDDRRRGARP